MGCPRCGQETAQIPNGLGGTTNYCVACGPSAYPRFVESMRSEPTLQRPGQKVTLIPAPVHAPQSETPPLLGPLIAEKPDDERQTTARLGLLREVLERIGEWWPEKYEYIASEINRVFKRASLAQLGEFGDLLVQYPAKHPLELLWQVKMKAEKSKAEEVKMEKT